MNTPVKERCYLAFGIGQTHHEAFPLLSSIELGELSIFFKDVPVAEYGDDHLNDHIKDMDWLEKNVVEFQSKMDDLSRTTPLIPFRFGTVYTSKASMKKFVMEYGKYFKENLIYFSDKLEWGLKVFLSESKFRKRIIQNESKKGLQYPDRPGSSFFEKKKTEYAAIEKEEDVLKTLLDTIRDKVSELSVEWKEIDFLDGLDKNPNSLKPIYNLSLLVKKNVSADLAHCLNTLTEELSDYGIKPILSGPWPPYNFVKMDNHN